MNKAKIGYLVKDKEFKTIELYKEFPYHYEYCENYEITKIVYFEVEDDS